MLKWLVLALIHTSAFAAPRYVEVWFLSQNRTSNLESILKQNSIKNSAPVAELQCQPMGELCFDPQYGLYKKEDMGATVPIERAAEVKAPSIPTGKSVERDLITCDPKNFFDVFCGKAQAEQKDKAKLEVWVDTSSSMREFDFSDKEGGCFRKSLIKRLDDSCSFNQKVNVMMFDTSIKQAGGMDSLCNNQGLNDFKRLIDWIERSDAKSLIVITDIYEFHKEFADYIESLNGKFRGDKDPLTGPEMLKLVDELAKLCR